MSTGSAPSGEAPRGRRSAAWGRGLVRLRWWVIGSWIAACLGSWFLLPALSDSGGDSNLAALVPRDTPAVATELRSVEVFGFPLSGRTVVVQRNGDGLSVFAQARTVVNALAADRGELPRLKALRGALPLTNGFGAFPGAREADTTALTYLLFEPDVSFGVQTRAARRYAAEAFKPRDSFVGITGSVPARALQGDIIRASLPRVETLTLAAIVLIVGVAFRSVLAPLVALLTTAAAYVVTLRLSGAVAALFGVATPSELEPVVVALLLGVVTDYTVFFLSALRRELAQGADRLDAARSATAQYGPIIAVAGLAVAAGTAALTVAQSLFFRALGPALVFTVLVAVVVAVTLVPALMAVLGRWCFWPVRPGRRSAGSVRRPGRRRAVLAWMARRRSVAGWVTAGCVAGLAVAAVPLSGLGLGVSFVGSLPGDSGVRQAADAARAGFAPGILSPTTVFVEGRGLDDQRGRLAALGRQLEQQPGVAGVLGPGDTPQGLSRGVLLKRDGSAARFLMVLEHPALGAAAIESVDSIDERLPRLIATSGLTHAEVGLAGDTATAAYIVDQTKRDLLRIAVTALAANFVMLLLFLRAPIAAVYLLAGSVLSLAASLGLTSLVFHKVDPDAGLTFYVPFAAAVMLLAFGSDYNIFAVGSVWDEARGRPLGEAIVAAMPAAVSALLVAGLALASSFGLLAVVPLMPFRELAFAMFVGIMLDVLVVRSLLVPALLTLFGRLSAWPRRRLMSSSVLHPQPADSAPSTERAAPPTTRRGDGPG